MRELSLHILDIAQNSLAAKAKNVIISVNVNSAANLLTITVEDDGTGIDKDFLKDIANPFSTTRTTRKAGMGIPLFKQAAETAGGYFNIESEKGKGTKVTAAFKADSIDRVPMGNLGQTITGLAANTQNADIILKYSVNGSEFLFDTREIKEKTGSADITDFELLQFLREYLEENIKSINGGISV